MSDHPRGFEPASLHLEATLEPRRSTPLGGTLRTLATIAVGLLTNDAESGPSAVDLVVTRRATGGEVLRVSAGTTEEAGRLLAHVRRDLDEKDVTEFVSEWRAPGPEPEPEPDPDATPTPDA